MSRWNYGCGEKIIVFIPKGWDYKEITVECGSTSITGGVWQCKACSEKYGQPYVPEYGDDIGGGPDDY